MSMYDTAAEGIRYYGQQGAAIAEGQRQSGQIWGQTLASLGQLVGNLPGQLAQQKELALRGQVTQAQLAQMKAAQEGQQRANQVIASLPKNGDGLFDTAAMAQQFAGANVPLPIAESFISSADKMNAIHRQTNQDKIDRLADVADVILSSHKAGEPVTPDALHLGFASAKNMGLASDADEQKFTEMAASSNPEGLLKGIRRLSKKYADLDKAIVLPRPGAVGTTAGAIQEAGGHVAAPNLPTTPKNTTELEFDAATIGTPNETPTAKTSAAALAANKKNPKESDAKAGSFEDYVNRFASEKGKAPSDLTTTDIDAARKKYREDIQMPHVSVTVGDTTNVKEVVAGMKDGSLPPQLPGRATKEYLSLMAEAHRQGFDLAKAATDWQATQKHISSMNGSQQLRLNQSINQLPELLDKVDALADKWKGGRFPLLNKANLALAKGGAFGKDAASIANQLDAQISDVVADLGNVYMGGNSPTDHALGLAQKSLSADWDQKVLKDMTQLARANVKTRLNSIKNTGVAGASDSNPYAAPAPAAAPKPTHRFNPATGKIEALP